MLVAAEASGDALGAALMARLRARMGEGVRFVGVGGPGMAGEGLQSPFDIAELSVLGFAEGVGAYRRVVRRADEAAALAARERPDAAILIDSWGFTLRVAQRLRRARPDLPLIKYVGPQVWASRPGRARTLAATVDHLLALHPFDAPFFERAGLPTTMVGSPVMARSFAGADGARFRARHGIAPDAPVLLVLPGSRPGEVRRLAPVFGEAVRRLKAERPALAVVVPAAATVAEGVRAAAAAWGVGAILVEDVAEKDDALLAGDVALACSGTATTELALAGVPVVVGYILGAVTHLAAKVVVTTRWASLVNVAAQAEVMPEFIQGRCTPANLARAVGERLDDAGLRARQRAAQDAALERMGRGGADPSDRATSAVLDVLVERGLLKAAHAQQEASS
ncbi:MAG: lipid-A-disaccharide synthase [Caulobacteraceae bacterium]|nr:lipid-A-disaccharide synthase [Caulobacter sp.]